MVMLSDAVTQKVAEGSAREDVKVLDVAQILQQSLAAPPPPPPEPEERRRPRPAPAAS
jgi:hypothetical protein